jgi:hypothetical protein
MARPIHKLPGGRHPQHANPPVKRKAQNGDTREKKVMTQQKNGHDLKSEVSIQKAFPCSTDSDTN